MPLFVYEGDPNSGVPINPNLFYDIVQIVPCSHCEDALYGTAKAVSKRFLFDLSTYLK